MINGSINLARLEKGSTLKKYRPEGSSDREMGSDSG